MNKLPTLAQLQAAKRIGILLLGGRSHRMGQDKATLPFKGETLGSYMKKSLEASLGPGGILISSGPTGVEDRVEDGGPLMGFDSVLRWMTELGLNLEGKILFVLPVDMPGLTPDLIRPLVPGEEESSRAYDGYALPLGLRITHATQARLLTSLDRLLKPTTKPEDRTFKELERLIESRKLKLPRGQAPRLLNVNTPEEWQQALAEF